MYSCAATMSTEPHVVTSPLRSRSMGIAAVQQSDTLLIRGRSWSTEVNDLAINMNIVITDTEIWRRHFTMITLWMTVWSMRLSNMCCATIWKCNVWTRRCVSLVFKIVAELVIQLPQLDTIIWNFKKKIVSLIIHLLKDKKYCQQ